jgi:hypothetical protein
MPLHRNSPVIRTLQKLARGSPECPLCGRFGRALSPSSQAEVVYCARWTDDELKAWSNGVEWMLAQLPPEPPPVVRSRRYDVDLFAEVKRRVRIEEIAAQLTELHGSGRVLTGACPFHNEQHGRAFVVWTDIQAWRCYGACQLKGDVIELMRVAMERGLWR